MSAIQENADYINWTTILKDAKAAEWIESLKPNTALAYRSGMIAICRFYKVTPSGMLEWDDPTEQVKQFILYLKKNAKPYGGKPRPGEFSVNSIPTYMYAICNFFEYYDIDLRVKKLIRMLPEQVDSDLRPTRRDEITKLLQIAKPRERMIILIPTACGAREAGVAEFELKHILIVDTQGWTLRPMFEFVQDKKVLLPVGSIGMIWVYGNSKKAKYVSFLNYEALLAIAGELEYRLLHLEKLLPSSPLVRDYFVPLGRNVNHARKITPARVGRIVAQLMDRAGVPRDELQPLHGLRKFFNTTCKNAGIDHMFKEMYMGHTIDLDRVYYDPEIPESLQKMTTEYVKAANALTINEENKLRVQVERLTKEKSHLEGILDGKIKEHDEILRTLKGQA